MRASLTAAEEARAWVREVVSDQPNEVGAWKQGRRTLAPEGGEPRTRLGLW